MNRILIVEDEEAISTLIRLNLTKAGYFCETAFDGLEAVEILQEQDFDLLLLDIMLPEMDGYEVFEYAKTLKIPAIFLTAMGETAQKVRGLMAGAEDYIAKPFEITELLARVNTVLRRFHKTDCKMRFLDIEVDTEAMTVTRAGIPVKLTCKEYELLVLFAGNQGRTLYRERIYEQVWGGEYLDKGRTVDLHVHRLKKKLGLEEHMIAMYKIGYRLEI